MSAKIDLNTVLDKQTKTKGDKPKRLIRKVNKKERKETDQTEISSLPDQKDQPDQPDQTEISSLEKSKSFNKLPKEQKKSKTGPYISSSKVKNVISNFVLNKKQYKSLIEIAKATPSTKKTIVDEVEVITVFEGTSIDKLSEETQLYLKEAIIEHVRTRSGLYTKTKISELSDVDRVLYTESKNKAKREFDKLKNTQYTNSKVFDTYLFNLSYDSKFYDEFKKAHDLSSSDSEWKRAYNLISKLKTRFSTNSKYILAFFIEYLANQVIKHSVEACVSENKKTVCLEHIVCDKYIGNGFALFPFISNLKTFKKAKAYLEELNEKGSDESNKDESMFLLDCIDVDKQYQFRYCISDMCQNAYDSIISNTKSESASRVLPSKLFKTFISTLICEVLVVVGNMINKEIDSRIIKTVSDSILDVIITHLHMAYGVDESLTIDYIKNQSVKCL